MESAVSFKVMWEVDGEVMSGQRSAGEEAEPCGIWSPENRGPAGSAGKTMRAWMGLVARPG